MKHQVVYLLAALILLSGCNTYTGAGAYTGSSLGSILGSAIGGITGGPRGSDVDTLVGMAGGAIVGAAIGSKADQQRSEALAARSEQRTQTRYAATPTQQDTPATAPGMPAYSGYDPNNGGDDRLYDFTSSDYTTNYTARPAVTTVPATSSVDELTSGLDFAPEIEIRNARFVDDNRDNAINRGEVCKVIFEVYNRGQQTLHDVVPTVVEATGNRHIQISPSVHVERLEPGHGIRYTAMVQADNRLSKGEARICVSVLQGGRTVSQVSEFSVPTRK